MGRASQEGPFLPECPDVPRLGSFILVMCLFLPGASLMLLGSILLVLTKEQLAGNLAASDSVEENKL